MIFGKDTGTKYHGATKEEAEAAVLSENSIRLNWRHGRIIASFWAMFAVLHALGMFAADLVKLRWQLEGREPFSPSPAQHLESEK